MGLCTQLTSSEASPANSTSLLQYSLAATPLVTSVTPAFGSSLGGTVVTITGSGFAVAGTDPVVVINSVPCAVTSASATSVTCVTGVRPAPPNVPPMGFKVTVGSVGDAITAKDETVLFR